MEKLSSIEEEVLQVTFRNGECNVKAVLEGVRTKMPYTTMASIIKNLEKKKFLESRLVGNTYLYKPSITEEEFKKKFMGNVVKDYFENSYKELVSFFVEQKKLSAKELKEILQMIEKEK